jgi:hypothetical protein
MVLPGAIVSLFNIHVTVYISVVQTECRPGTAWREGNSPLGLARRGDISIFDVGSIFPVAGNECGRPGICIVGKTAGRCVHDAACWIVSEGTAHT